jgi:hypothetical protein
MSETPDLGTTWNQAVEACYSYGYEEYEDDDREIVRKLRAVADVIDDGTAIDLLMNDYDWVISDDGHSGNGPRARLWGGIEDFYADHMTVSAQNRLDNEAAVAEDLVTAWETGAIDALLDRGYGARSLEGLKRD